MTSKPKRAGDKAASTAPAGRLSMSPLPPLVQMAKSAVLGISRSQLYRWAAEDRITIRKIGRSSYVETESVMKLIAELPIAKIGPGSAK